MAKRGLTFSNDQTVPLEDSSPSMLWSRFNNKEKILNTFDTNHKLFIHAYYMAYEKKNEMLKCKMLLQYNDLKLKYDKIITLITDISNTVTPYKCAMYACAKYKIHSDETTDDETKNNQISELLTYKTKYNEIFDPMINTLIYLKKKSYDRKNILVNAFTYACVKGNLNALKKLIDKFGDDSILVWYNLTNNSIYEWVSGPRGPLSIESGYINMSLLHIACYYNHLDIVRYLLEVNELNQIEPICDVNGLNQIDLPPIYYACERGHETIVYELITFITINDTFYIKVTDNNLQKLRVYTTAGGKDGEDMSIGDTIQLSEVVHYRHSYKHGHDRLLTYLKTLERHLDNLESLKRERPSEPVRKKQKTSGQLRF